MRKKIYLIMADENLFHPLFVSRLIKAIGNDYQIVGITKTLDSYKSGFFNFLKQQLHLWGYVGFLYIGLMTFVYSLLDKLNLKSDLSLRSIAAKNNLKYTETFNVNEEKHLKYLEKLKIDVIISSCGHIFKKDLLKLPKIACINRHTALLPKYGGVLPVFWAMYFEEKKFGVSIHYMLEKIDQGDIISQVEIPLMKENSLFKNYRLGFDKSVDALILALENLKKKKIVSRFYSNEKQYFSFPVIKNIQGFRAKGYKSFSYKDIFWV